MSWLNIRGKMYHCLKCSEIVKVEYKGGACLTQIGDNRLYEQTALTKDTANQLQIPILKATTTCIMKSFASRVLRNVI
ncbi:MAG: hypothetical protein HS127_19605 [Planctomycetia bacterium]|nr:hypothetical protein [Planctomycetia bacterium]